MDMSEVDFDIIEASVRGQLTPPQQEGVNERLKTDPVFRQAYEDVRLMISAAKSVARDKMLAELRNAQKEKGRFIAWPFYRMMALAASIVLIAVVGVWLYQTREEDLFEKYYAPNKSLSFSQPRGDASAYDIKMNALREYKNHQPKTAIQTLDTAFAMNPNDEEALFLAGLCYLEAREFYKSLEEFNKIKDNQDDAVLWYKALAYLGAGNNDQAKNILSRLAESQSSPYAKRAAELIKKLTS